MHRFYSKSGHEVGKSTHLFCSEDAAKSYRVLLSPGNEIMIKEEMIKEKMP